MIEKDLSSYNNLSIWGKTPPLFSEPLHVGQPNIHRDQAFNQGLDDIFNRRYLTNNGFMVQKFEKEIRDYIGVKHCILVANGTLAIQLLAKVLGFRRVLMPAYTFIASAHALKWIGIEPVFCDIKGWFLDPEKITHLSDDDYDAIMPVNLWGGTCEIDRFETFAQNKGKPLIFDSAQGFGTQYKGTPLGNFGIAEVFSFHATKIVNSLEGGAIVTNDDVLAKHLQLARNFGFVGYDQVETLGINAKLNEISALMGLSNLSQINQYLSQNKRNFELYRETFKGSPLKLVEHPLTCTPNYHYVVCEVEDNTLTRDDFVRILTAENILVRRYFFPGCHQIAPYNKEGWYLPETDKKLSRVICFPTGRGVKEKDIEKIGELLHLICSHDKDIQQRLAHDN